LWCERSAKQREVYDVTASSIVDSVLQGFNGTIFAVSRSDNPFAGVSTS
jgi:hypothetical protein